MTPQEWVALFLAEHLPEQAHAAVLPEEVAQVVVDALKLAADDHWYKDPQRSLIYAERIVLIGKNNNTPRFTALGHMARGDALKFMGRIAEAWEALELAGELYLQVKDEVGWARTRIGRLYVSVQLKRATESLADVERAADIFRAVRWPERLMRLHIQTAYVLNYLGEHKRAIALLHEQLEVLPSLGEEGERLRGIIHINLGSAYLSCGELTNALTHFEQARALAEARQETLNLALIESDIADVYRTQGQHRRALLTLQRALEYAATDEGYQATLQQDLAECYLNLNRYADARTVTQAACAKLQAQNKNFELARTLVQWATAEIFLGRYLEANQALAEAATIFDELKAANGQIQVQLWRGHLALRQGELEKAQLAAEQAAHLAQANHQQVRLAQAHLLRGQVALLERNFTLAEQTGTATLATARQQNLPALRYSAHVLLGRATEAQARWGRAQWHYQAAEAVLERQQRHLTLTLRSEFLLDKEEAFRALIALHLRRGQAEAAWQALERAKSQNWLGYLNQQNQFRWQTDTPQVANLLAELEQLRGEHHWWCTQAQAAPHADGASPAYSPDQIHGEVQAREKRLRAITEKLYLHNEAGERANPAPLASLSAVQGTLNEATALVEFYNDGQQLWAFVLTAHALRVVALPTPAQTVARLHKQLHLNLHTLLRLERASAMYKMFAERTVDVLQKLHAAIFTPLGLHAPTTPNLILVPYGAWHLLPLHLLHNSQQFLFEQFELVNLPAASLRTLTPPRRAPGAVILSHSSNGQLPLTHVEAEWVHGLWGGQWFPEAEATRAAFRHAPQQILHVAAHGQYRPDQPDLSHLELADGQLYADDLFQHDLSYELVTLSACETGQSNAQSHDELIGLGRGFLFAGAGALLQSLWQVPDATALALMKSFYTELKTGVPKTTALRQALCQQLLADGPAHLADWGAFQLIGNPEALTSL